MTDLELYRRGIDTAVTCWERFARSTRGATVHRLRHADVAVFPDGPESTIYNNAVVFRGLALKYTAASSTESQRGIELGRSSSAATPCVAISSIRLVGTSRLTVVTHES